MDSFNKLGFVYHVLKQPACPFSRASLLTVHFFRVQSHGVCLAIICIVGATLDTNSERALRHSYTGGMCQNRHSQMHHGRCTVSPGVFHGTRAVSWQFDASIFVGAATFVAQFLQAASLRFGRTRRPFLHEVHDCQSQVDTQLSNCGLALPRCRGIMGGTRQDEFHRQENNIEGHRPIGQPLCGQQRLDSDVLAAWSNRCVCVCINRDPNKFCGFP